MSGVRQHFIPRFLQKGFRIPSNGKIVRSWVYEHGRPPRPANIADVGLERYFYAVDAETELDDKITEAEQHAYAPLIDRLREGSVEAGDVGLIAEMLAHFEVRSRHVRQNMYSLFDDCTTQLIGHLSNPQTLALLIEDHLKPGSEIFDRELKKLNISYDQIQWVFSTQGKTLQDVLRPWVSAYAAGIGSALPTFRAQITNMVKQTHLRILSQSMSPAARAARLTSLKYVVRDYVSGDLPLGDAIVLFHVKGDRAFKPFLDKDDEVIHVVLPLSSHQYLLGASDDAQEEPTYDLAEQIAACSMMYFIARSDQLTDLQGTIGSKARWISKAETQSIMESVVQEMLPKSLS